MACTCDGYPAIPDDHTDKAADALCKILKDHEARGEMGCFDRPTLKWWKEHKKRDAQKVKEDLSRDREARLEKAIQELRKTFK
jgi:glycosyltransferase involved in cell wall biosynthesis